MIATLREETLRGKMIGVTLYGEPNPPLVKFLEGAGIEPVGRYGKWEYSSMEDAIIQGREVAKKIRSAPST